jgi:hypothetical protein
MNGNYNQMQMQQPIGMNPMQMPQQMPMNPMQMPQQLPMNPMQMQQHMQQQMQPYVPQITGPTGGTSIADLRTDINPQLFNQRQYNNQGQQQQQQYIQTPRQPRQKKRREDKEDNIIETDGPNMELLVKDLNRDLDDYAPSKIDRDTDDLEGTETDKEKHKSSLKWYKKLIPNFVKEILLLIFIYILFSQGFIKKLIGNHISYVNQNAEGNVPFIGVVIYGSILAIFYIIFKIMLIS